MTDLELQRTELADSIVSAVSSLRGYKHRRLTLEGVRCLQSALLAAQLPCAPS